MSDISVDALEELYSLPAYDERYSLIMFDDSNVSGIHVITVFITVFNYAEETIVEKIIEIETQGSAVVYTGSFEDCEKYRNAIHTVMAAISSEHLTVTVEKTP